MQRGLQDYSTLFANATHPSFIAIFPNSPTNRDDFLCQARMRPFPKLKVLHNIQEHPRWGNGEGNDKFTGLPNPTGMFTKPQHVVKITQITLIIMSICKYFIVKLAIGLAFSNSELDVWPLEADCAIFSI